MAKILIVDDEPKAVEELVFALEAAKLRAVGATSVKDAVSIFLADDEIGVVVSDIRMPVQSGIELASLIRRSGLRGENCEILLITGFPELETAMQAVKIRAFRYLEKPPLVPELLVAVSEAANRYEATVALQKGARGDTKKSQREVVRDVSRPSQAEDDGPGLASSDDGAENHHFNVIESLLKLRELRAQHLPGDLFADPTWFMLLDLAVLERKGRRVSVSALCQTSGVSQTTALRRVQELVDLGLVQRLEDPADGRRIYLTITEKAKDKLEKIVSEIDRKS